MNIRYRFLTILLLSFSIFVMTYKTANAVYIAKDTVKIYENSKPVNDSLLLWATDSGNGDFCVYGVCEIGQQYYPVIIYRLSSNDIIKFADFVETRPKPQGVEYHDYLKENSVYYTSYNPGPSEGGVSCGDNCEGGRIGDDRTLEFDLNDIVKDYVLPESKPSLWERLNQFYLEIMFKIF